jgi:hypothetical protein
MSLKGEVRGYLLGNKIGSSSLIITRISVIGLCSGFRGRMRRLLISDLWQESLLRFGGLLVVFVAVVVVLLLLFLSTSVEGGGWHKLQSSCRGDQAAA